MQIKAENEISFEATVDLKRLAKNSAGARRLPSALLILWALPCTFQEKSLNFFISPVLTTLSVNSTLECDTAVLGDSKLITESILESILYNTC